jgi:hypothetical protein
VAPVLLSGGDYQRGLVVPGGDHGPHRVAEAGARVQIDQGRPPHTLREPLGHPERRRLLEAEHVAKVFGEVLKKRQLRRAGVAENRRHPQTTQEIEARPADRCHNTPSPP